MKKALFTSLLLTLAFAMVSQALAAAAPTDSPKAPTLTLIGHSSVKIVTSAGTVVYIDPYAKGAKVSARISG